MFFSSIQELLSTNASITATLVLNGNGTITATVIAKSKSGASGLQQPISLTGTAQELDEGFADAMKIITGQHVSLNEQIEQTNKALAEEAKEKLEKTSKKSAKSPSKVASSKTDDDEENDGEGEGLDNDEKTDNDAGNALPTVSTAATSLPTAEAAKPVKFEDLFGDA